MKFYDGMLVSGEIGGKKVERGALRQVGKDMWVFCQDVVGWLAVGGKRFSKAWDFSMTDYENGDSDVKNLRPLYTTDVRDAYVGARIKGKKGKVSTVLGICGECIFISIADASRRASANVYSFYDLIKYGFTLVPPEGSEGPKKAVKEVTMAEVCERFGAEVKIKKE